MYFFFFKQKTAYEMRISDWSSDVCSSDLFARYRIDDPLLFFQSVRSEETARPRLNTIINGSLRQILGNATLSAVLSQERTEILRDLRESVDEETPRVGLAQDAVRIRRATLPGEPRDRG